MEGRYVRESVSEYSELALPNDANGLGNLLGGKIMHLVDLTGAIAAMKHARQFLDDRIIEVWKGARRISTLTFPKKGKAK